MINNITEKSEELDEKNDQEQVEAKFSPIKKISSVTTDKSNLITNTPRLKLSSVLSRLKENGQLLFFSFFTIKDICSLLRTSKKIRDRCKNSPWKAVLLRMYKSAKLISSINDEESYYILKNSFLKKAFWANIEQGIIPKQPELFYPQNPNQRMQRLLLG